MRKVGLIGGLSWHSTLEYYRIINQLVNTVFQSNTNPPLWLVNLNQSEIHQLQQNNQWDKIVKIVYESAFRIQEAGCEALALCTNTSHKVIDLPHQPLQIPFLHIADAIGEKIKFHGWHKVGLLGTKFTMTEDFIKGRLNRDYQTEIVVPNPSIQLEIHRRIVEEFSLGIFNADAKTYFLNEMERMASEGTQAVILGCTEIPLLLKDSILPFPDIDSLECHCRQIVRFILSDNQTTVSMI